MELEPESKVVVRMIAALGRPPIERSSARELRALSVTTTPDPADAAMLDASDRTIAGVPVRLYRPKLQATGILLYFHGGGFVLGSLETIHAVAAAIAVRTGTLLVSIDYRLAPEHPFPAAVDDALAVLRWVDAHREELLGDGAPLLVAGESAGATLAAVCAIQARNEGIPIGHQTLIYPATDDDFDRPSYRTASPDLPLTAAAMRWFWDQYAAPAARQDWRACPLRAPDLSDGAPAHIVLAGHDPLHDEGKAYAERLQHAGVPVTIDDRADLMHGFFAFTATSPGGYAAMEGACAAIRQALSGAS